MRRSAVDRRKNQAAMRVEHIGNDLARKGDVQILCAHSPSLDIEDDKASHGHGI